MLLGRIFIEEIVVKFIKFSLVGTSGLFIDYGITYVLKEKAHFQKYIANSLGFVSAVCTNYILNRIWTFQSQNPAVAVEYTKFFVISIIGLGINNLVLFIFHGIFKKNFYLSKLIAIGVTTFWNFTANYLYTFG